jgi:hypothetical protein
VIKLPRNKCRRRVAVVAGSRQDYSRSNSKNRVWSFGEQPSGRPNAEPHLSWETAAGSVQWTCESVSGLAEWLSRDPEEEGSDVTLYSYVLNNPVSAFDSLGLIANITVNGTTYTATDATQFQNIVSNAGANSISNITVDGHGSANTQTFGYTDADLYAQGSQIALGNGNNDPYLKSSNNDPGIPLAKLLQGKLSPGAVVNLLGCDTGSPGTADKPLPNIAQSVSSALGAISVGSPGLVNSLNQSNAGFNVYANGSLEGNVTEYWQYASAFEYGSF